MKHLIIGYHGASRDSVEKPVRQEFNLSKSAPGNWLGPGLYFWEQDEYKAWQWLKDTKTQSPAVLKAQINLSLGTFDLTTRRPIYNYRKFLRQYMTQGRIAEKFANLIGEQPFGDHLWVPFFIRSYEKESDIRIHAIRASVLTGDKAYQEFKEQGEKTLTAYSPSPDSVSYAESRIVTRMSIIVALLSKKPIEKEEILLNDPT